MAKKFDIQHYKDGLNFYLDRLHYYGNLLNDYSKFIHTLEKGYGKIEFYMTRENAQFMYDYWFQGMVEYIQKDKCRTCEKRK